MAEEDVTLRVEAPGAKESQKSIEAVTAAMVEATKASQNQHAIQERMVKGLGEQKAGLNGIGESLKMLHGTFQQGSGAINGFGGALNTLGTVLTTTRAAGTGLTAALGTAGVAGAVSGLAGPIGITIASLGAFYAAMQYSVTQVMHMYEEMKSLQAMTGLSIGETENIIDAFALAGVESGRLQMAFFRLGGEIEGGGKHLEKFGISVQETTGEFKAEGDILLEVRDRLSQIGSASERNAALMQLFGRAGRALAPVFAKSTEEFNKYIEAAKQYDQMTENLMKQGQEYHQVLTEISFAFQKMYAGFAEAVAFPVLTGLAHAFLAVIDAYLKFKEFQEDIKNILQGALFGGGGATVGEMKVLEEQVRVQDRLMKQAELVRKYKMDTAEGRISPLAAQRAEQELKREEQLQQIQLSGDTKLNAARLKLDKELLQSRISLAADRVKLETDSEAAVIAVQRDALAETATLDAKGLEQKRSELDKRLAMTETSHAKELDILRRSTPAGQKEDFDKKTKIEAQYNTEKAKLSEERRQLDQEEVSQTETNAAKKQAIDFKYQQARLNDLKKAINERIDFQKTMAEAENLLIENTKNRQLAILNMGNLDAISKIREQANVEIETAEKVRDAKIQSVESQRSALEKQRELATGNAAMQKEIDQKLMGLGMERYRAEVSADNQIVAARKGMVDQLKAEADREAGIGESLAQKAVSRMQARGRTRFSQEDIQSEISKMREQGADVFGRLGTGGRVTGTQLSEAIGSRGMFADLAKSGIGAGTALTMMGARGSAAFGGRPFEGLGAAGTSFAPAGTSTFAPAQAPITNEMIRNAGQMGYGPGSMMAAIPTPDTTPLVTAYEDAFKKIPAAIDASIVKIGEKIDEGWVVIETKLTDKVSENMVRRLEFEAARS